MKKLQRFTALAVMVGLLAQSAGCTLPFIHTHTPGPEATCTEAQVCTQCGEVLAEATGHLPGTPATCAEPQVCTLCGEVLAEATGDHTPGEEATCTEPQFCTVCGKVLVAPPGHMPETEVSCTEPQVCSVCGKVLGDAPGHVPGEEATCTEPQVCTVCGQVLVEANGSHTPGEATCTTPSTCTVCGEVLSTETGAHLVDDDGVCTVCGEQVLPEGLTVYQPGAGSATTDSSEGLVWETESSGHYNSSGSSYTSSGVLICGDYGMEYLDPPTSGDSDWADAVNGFVARYPELNTTALLIPKCTAFESPSDEYDPYDDTASFIQSTYDMIDDSVKKADCIGVMSEHKGEYMFYRTDHHWTGLGGYYASVAYCNANDIEPWDLDSYETTVTTGVIGTLYSFSGGDSHLTSNPDYTVCHYPHTAYTMEYGSPGSMWDAPALDSDYGSYASCYIRGDNPITVITTANTTGRVLLVFKASYGNAFVPYMIDYYDTIIVLDARDTDGSTREIIEEYGVTDALFINNISAAMSISDYVAERCMD